MNSNTPDGWGEESQGGVAGERPREPAGPFAQAKSMSRVVRDIRSLPSSCPRRLGPGTLGALWEVFPNGPERHLLLQRGRAQAPQPAENGAVNTQGGERVWRAFCPGHTFLYKIRAPSSLGSSKPGTQVASSVLWLNGAPPFGDPCPRPRTCDVILPEGGSLQV